MPAFHNAYTPAGELSPSEELAKKLENINKELEDQAQPSTPSKPVATKSPSLTKEPPPTPTLTKETPKTAKLEVQKPETPAPNGNAADATTWQNVSESSFS